jgi:prevent-host-death family protein
MVMKTAATLEPVTRTIAAGEFKAKCLQLMDEVNAGKLTLVITKHGRPVSHLVQPPQESKPFRSIVGRTPGVDAPNRKGLAKLKDEWTADWDESTKHLASLLKAKSKKSRRA